MDFQGKEELRADCFTAYIQAKALINQPKKEKHVHIIPKNPNSDPYDYFYADLAAIDSAIIKATKQVTDSKGRIALSYIQDVHNNQDGVIVTTEIIFSNGGRITMPPMWFKTYTTSSPQQIAGIITYAKRYSLSAAFGIASEDDDDIKTLIETGNYQPSDNPPHKLGRKELDEYKVQYLGISARLVDVYQDYIDGVPEANGWIRSRHDEQTAIAIKQLNQAYHQQEAEKKSKEEQAAKAAKEAEEKKAALDKVKQSKVEESKKDPFADKKVASGGDTVVDGLF